MANTLALQVSAVTCAGAQGRSVEKPKHLSHNDFFLAITLFSDTFLDNYTFITLQVPWHLATGEFENIIFFSFQA